MAEQKATAVRKSSLKVSASSVQGEKQTLKIPASSALASNSQHFEPLRGSPVKASPVKEPASKSARVISPSLVPPPGFGAAGGSGGAAAGASAGDAVATAGLDSGPTPR